MTTALSKYGRRKYNNGTSNGDDPEEQDVYNECGDIITGMSRLGITGHQSPGRYTTKEGECSVESCLNQFTALELMTGSNKVVCEACTAREKKVKKSDSLRFLKKLGIFKEICKNHYSVTFFFSSSRVSKIISYFFYLLLESRRPVENGVHFEYQAIPHFSSTSGIDTTSKEISNAESRFPEGFQARVVSDIARLGTGLHKSQKTSTLCALWGRRTQWNCSWWSLCCLCQGRSYSLSDLKILEL